MTTVNDQSAERILDVDEAHGAAIAEYVERNKAERGGSPVYPAALTGPDCGCPVYYAVTQCQHGEYACNLCNVEHRADCARVPADVTGAMMRGFADVGLPSPDQHAVAAHTVASELRSLADSVERSLTIHGRADVTPGYLRRLADRLSDQPVSRDGATVSDAEAGAR